LLAAEASSIGDPDERDRSIADRPAFRPVPGMTRRLKYKFLPAARELIPAFESVEREIIPYRADDRITIARA